MQQTEYYTQPLRNLAQVVISEPDSTPNPLAVEKAMEQGVGVPMRKFLPVLSQGLAHYPGPAAKPLPLWRHCVNIVKKKLKREAPPVQPTAPTDTQVENYRTAFVKLEDALIDETGLEGYTGGILEQCINVNLTDVIVSLGKLERTEVAALRKLAPAIKLAIEKRDAAWQKRRQTLKPAVALG